MTAFLLFISLYLPWIVFLGVVAQAVIPAAVPIVSQVCLQPLEWFQPDPNQVRKVFDEEDLRRLGASLLEKQLQPLVAHRNGAHGTIICGERRYRAAKLVGLSHLEVKILEGPLTEAQIRAYQITENMQRADLTQQEQVHGCIDFMAINPGIARKDCAAQLHLDPASVTKFLSYLDAIPIVQKAFDDAKIGLRDMSAIASAPTENQEGLLNLKTSEKLTAEQLESRVRKQKNGTASAPAAKVAKVKLPLISGVTVQLSGADLDLKEVFAILTDLLKQTKMAINENIDVNAFMVSLASKVKNKAKES